MLRAEKHKNRRDNNVAKLETTSGEVKRSKKEEQINSEERKAQTRDRRKRTEIKITTLSIREKGRR